MIYNTTIPTLAPEDRKLALEKLIEEMCIYYVLSRKELLEYKLWLFAPEDLQVDLCIHLLNLYKSVLNTDMINTILQNNKDLVDNYKAGNAKAINSILGRILSIDKSIDPKECVAYLKEIL